MERISKIKKYLSSQEISLKYIGTFKVCHSGGCSFYNNGYALYNNYEISKGNKKYIFKVKVTGRPEYRVCNNNETIAIGFSQGDILKYFVLNKDMHGNVIY